MDGIDDYIKAMPDMFEQLSGLEFVMHFIIPCYLAALKTIKDDVEHLQLKISDRYRPNDDPSVILMREILEEQRRIIDSYKESDERWSELWDISLMTHGRFLWNFSQNYMLLLPDSVIKQLKR